MSMTSPATSTSTSRSHKNKVRVDGERWPRTNCVVFRVESETVRKSKLVIGWQDAIAKHESPQAGSWLLLPLRSPRLRRQRAG